jgi:beta-ring hydroxylase
VDTVLGDRRPGVEDMRALRFTTRVINESMRLYPQPPVLIRRALEDDAFDKYTVRKGSDIFISVWNLHHSPTLWEDSERCACSGPYIAFRVRYP